MLPFRVLRRFILETGTNLASLGSCSLRHHTSDRQAVCKLVTLQTPTDACIPFLFNQPPSIGLRCRPTEPSVSHLFSCPSGRSSSQQGGTPLYPERLVRRVYPDRFERGVYPACPERIHRGGIFVRRALPPFSATAAQLNPLNFPPSILFLFNHLQNAPPATPFF
jgi:hypothetical protein